MSVGAFVSAERTVCWWERCVSASLIWALDEAALAETSDLQLAAGKRWEWFLVMGSEGCGFPWHSSHLLLCGWDWRRWGGTRPTPAVLAQVSATPSLLKGSYLFADPLEPLEGGWWTPAPASSGSAQGAPKQVCCLRPGCSEPDFLKGPPPRPPAFWLQEPCLRRGGGGGAYPVFSCSTHLD